MRDAAPLVLAALVLTGAVQARGLRTTVDYLKLIDRDGDARVSPASVMMLQPFSTGGDAGNIVVQCGDGVATLTHGTGRSGQEYRFVIVNL